MMLPPIGAICGPKDIASGFATTWLVITHATPARALLAYMHNRPRVRVVDETARGGVDRGAHRLPRGDADERAERREEAVREIVREPDAGGGDARHKRTRQQRRAHRHGGLLCQ